MKKIFLLLILPVSLFAQEFKEGTNVVGAGIGFGGHFGSYTYSSQSPGLGLQYERGMWPVGGPGIISLGAYAGFKTIKHTYYAAPFNVTEKWNYTIIGIRSAYHYNGLNVDKLDVYGGIMLSYNILSYKYDTNAPNNYFIANDFNNEIGFSPYVGGRYYLTDNIAAFAELGYGVSYLTLGASLRF
jgi:hypothetical protein